MVVCGRASGDVAVDVGVRRRSGAHCRMGSRCRRARLAHGERTAGVRGWGPRAGDHQRRRPRCCTPPVPIRRCVGRGSERHHSSDRAGTVRGVGAKRGHGRVPGWSVPASYEAHGELVRGPAWPGDRYSGRCDDDRHRVAASVHGVAAIDLAGRPPSLAGGHAGRVGVGRGGGRDCRSNGPSRAAPATGDSIRLAAGGA